jgi:hypothetical protein
MSRVLGAVVQTRPTFDETPPCPFDLSGHEHLGRSRTGPNETGPRLDAKDVSARDIGGPRRRNDRDVLVRIHVVEFIRYLALGLFWPDPTVERLDVAKVTFEELGSRFTRSPIGHLDVCRKGITSVSDAKSRNWTRISTHLSTSGYPT